MEPDYNTQQIGSTDTARIIQVIVTKLLRRGDGVKL